MYQNLLKIKFMQKNIKICYNFNLLLTFALCKKQRIHIIFKKHKFCVALFLFLQQLLLQPFRGYFYLYYPSAHVVFFKMKTNYLYKNLTPY